MTAGGTARLRRRAFALEYGSMAWMVAEAAVAITAGVLASSIALTGFGLDSVIEFFAAAIVVWQLRGEIAGQERETRAVRPTGITGSFPCCTRCRPGCARATCGCPDRAGTPTRPPCCCRPGAGPGNVM